MDLDQAYFDAISQADPREVIEIEGVLLEGSETKANDPNLIRVNSQYDELLGDDVTLHDVSIIQIHDSDLEFTTDPITYFPIGTKFTIRGTRV